MLGVQTRNDRRDEATQAEGRVCTEGEQSGHSLVNKREELGNGMKSYQEEVRSVHGAS